MALNKKVILVSILLNIVYHCVFAKTVVNPVAGQPHDSASQPYVEVYGHRGARCLSPENTLPGYKTALKIGVDWVDLDIVVTRDNELMVYHDLWLNPDIVSKNGVFWAKSKEDFFGNLPADQIEQKIVPYLIHNLTREQLKQYDVGVLNPSSQYATFFSEQVAVPNTVIPTMQEVIDYVNKAANKRVNFQIQIKTDPTHPAWSVSSKKFAALLYQMINKNKLIDRVEVQSFDWQSLYELQKLDKRIKTAYLAAMPQFSDSKETILWNGGKHLKDYHNSLPQMVKALGGACYEPEDVMLTKKDLEEAHQLGLKVVVWRSPEHTGNAFSYKATENLIKWGVDGIITDDPSQLVTMLIARGQRVPPTFEREN